MSTHGHTFLPQFDSTRTGPAPRRHAVRLAGLVAVLALGASACGGKADVSSTDTGDDSTETTSAPDDSTKFGWTLDVPGEWSETDPGVAQKLWMVADGAASVNVLTEDFPEGTVIDLQGYLDAAIPQLASYIDGAEVTDTSFVEGDHHMLAILDYTGSVDSTFIWYRAVIGLDEAASKAVIVTFATADKDVYDAQVVDVTNIALTLRID